MKRIRLAAIFILSFMLANAPGWSAALAADLYWDGSQQFFDAGGDPLAGGTISTYDAGTTTNRTTFQDADETTPNTNPIVLDSSGRMPAALYIDEGTWKYILRDSAGATISTQDNLPGAAPAVTVDSAKRECPIEVKTSTYSIVAADMGKCFEGNATSGAMAFNLPSAVTVGIGKMVTVRKSDSTAAAVTVVTAGGQQINGNGTSVQLVTKDSIVELISTGAAWVTNNALGIAPGSISDDELDASITSRLVKIGEMIVWSGETCPAGYLEAAGQTNIPKADYPDLYALYSNDGAQPAIYGESGDNFTLLDTRGIFIRGFNNAKDAGLFDPDAATRTARGDGTAGDVVGTTQAHAVIQHQHVMDTTDPQTGGNDADPVPIQRRIAASGLTGDISSGVPATNVSTETRGSNIQLIHCIFADPEASAGAIAAFNTILSGPGQPVDATGNDGDWWIDTNSWNFYFKTAGAWVPETNLVGQAAINSRFDSETAAQAPDTVSFNSNTVSAITYTYVNETDAGGVDISAYLATIVDGTIKVGKRGSSQDFLLADVTGPAEDQGDYWRIPVTALAATDGTVSNFLSDNDLVQFAYWQRGEDGAAGLPGPTVSVTWNFDSATGDADPGDGNYRVSVADLTTCNVAASCQLYMDNLEAGGTDITAWLDTWDDSGTADNRGTLTLVNPADSTIFYVLQIRNLVVDGTGYRKVDFIYLSGSGQLASATAFTFSARGASGTGDVSGPGSSINGNLASWNGVGGDTLADAGASVADIDPRGKHTVNLLAVGMVARTTNGATLYTAEKATNSIMVAGYEFSASVNQAIQIAFQMPESYDATQALDMVMYWTTSATIGSGDVVWNARARCVGDDQAIDGAWGTAAVVTDGFLADGDQHVSASVSMTPNGTCGKNVMLYVELSRDAANASDTYTQTAILQAAQMRMTVLAPNDD